MPEKSYTENTKKKQKTENGGTKYRTSHHHQRHDLFFRLELRKCVARLRLRSHIHNT